MKYRPEIDGMRAVAVLPVILFHAGFSMFSGGFVGVDVFFVISGYLITSIIVKDLEAGTFSFWEFYERRARRILPGLFFVIICCIPFAWMWMMPMELKAFSTSMVAAIVFMSNILFWRQSGYFDTAAELKPLLHTWSLAVEEQFYIFFPIAMLVLWRFGRRTLVPAIALVALISLALSEYGSRYHPSFNFYWLPTRAWELAAGSLCAFVAIRPKAVRDDLMSVVGLAGIILAILYYDEITPFPSFYALPPVLGTCAIILFARQRTVLCSLLSSKTSVGLGQISYSAYLWHQPLFAFARIRELNGGGSEPTQAVMLFLAAMSILLAYFSWRFIELPARQRGTPASLAIKPFVLLVVTVGLLLTTSGLAIHFAKGFPIRSSHLEAEMAKALEKAKAEKNFGAIGQAEQRLTDCRFNVGSLDSEIIKEIRNCYTRYGRGILVLGDSHAIDLFGVLASRFDERFLVGITRVLCRPHTPLDECQYDAVLSFVKANSGVFRAIIFEQAGFYLMKSPDGMPGSRNMFSKIPKTESVGEIDLDENHISLTLNYLLELASSTKTVWFGPRTEPHIDPRALMRSACQKPLTLRDGQEHAFAKLDEYLKKEVSRAGIISYVSQNQIFRFNWDYDIRDCDGFYFHDGDHYSAAGEERFGQRLPDNFLEMP